jgi:endonuclease G
MKKLLVLLLLVPFTSFGQVKLRDSVKVKTAIYEVMYSEVLEEPLWLKYSVKCPNGTASRAGMDFYTEKGIKTSDNADYVSNVYDKGHMAPAADFNCDRETLLKTFSYLNCALQNQYLNRGVWKTLEIQERVWAQKEPVAVHIICVFNKSCIKLATGATVPAGFYKIITLGKSKKTYKYYFPNETPKSKELHSYLVK